MAIQLKNLAPVAVDRAQCGARVDWSCGSPLKLFLTKVCSVTQNAGHVYTSQNPINFDGKIS